MTPDPSRFFELSSDLLCVIGPEEQLEIVNRAFARAFGIGVDDLPARSFFELVHPNDVDTSRADLARARTHTEAVRFACRCRMNAGEFVDLRWTASGTAETAHLYLSCPDVSGSTQTEARFRLAVEASPIATLMVNAAGKILLVNRELERLFRYRHGMLVGESVEILIPEGYRASHKGHRKSFAAKPEERSMGRMRDLTARRSDGTEFPVEIGLYPVDTEQGPTVLASLIDLTLRVEAEAEREKLIGQLQEALNEVKTLRGFIPICANCKKVRDDAGFWQSVESYVAERTGAAFSHGVCPECGPKLYPEYWDPAPSKAE
jgi:PAS domain S-box-containing protein